MGHYIANFSLSLPPRLCIRSFRVLANLFFETDLRLILYKSVEKCHALETVYSKNKKK